MTLKLRLAALLLAVAPFLTVAQSQDKCDENLSEAQKAFTDGLLEKIPALLEPCINSYGKVRKVIAYRTLLLAHLYNEQYVKADEVTAAFLKFNPDYEFQSDDPPELINQLTSFRTEPLYSIGITGGLNTSNVQVTQQFGMFDTRMEESKISTFSPGFQVSLKGNAFLYKGLRADLELGLMQRKYNFVTADDALHYGFSRTSYQETQTYFEIPISVTYDFFARSKIQPYARAGMSLGFLMNAESTLERANEETNGIVSGASIDMKPLRANSNYWLLAGIGGKLNVSKGNIFLGLDYKRGMKNQVDVLNRYSNDELLYNYYYVDNDFKIHNWALSIGYVYSIYNPTKQKSKTGRRK